MAQQAKSSKCPLLIFVILIVFASQTYSQTPTSFQYQAVLRDATGGILTNQDVEIGIAILQGSITGTEIFSETHLVTTNSFGLANLQIGSVNTVAMEAINWGAGPYFVQVSVDKTIMGTSQLLSVPYALYAKYVENDLVDDADNDPTNELQDISFENGELSISKGNSIPLSSIIPEVDTSNTNELQDISLTGTELSISEGSTVDLSVLQDGIGTDSQKLRFTNNKYLEITNGNTVRLPFLYKEDDGDPDNELQTLSKSGLEISLNQNGGTVRDSILTEAQVDTMVANNGYQLSANDYDTDPNNEIQVLSISNDTIYLVNGGFVKLPAETDPIFSAWDRSTGVAISESQITNLDHFTNADETDPIYAADSAFIKSGVRDWDRSLAKQITATDTTHWGNDTSPTNELQFLSISNDTIYLANGGFVKLPAEVDPIFSEWDRSTGVAISESQITDLQHFTNADETDPAYSADSLFLKAGVESWNSSLAKQITAIDTTRWGSDVDPANELQDIEEVLVQGNDAGGRNLVNLGNVGLGVPDPDAKLEVAGQVKITGGSPGVNKILTSDANGLARWDNLSETDPQVGENTTNYLSKWNGSALVKSTIFDNGNIGIGESNPDYRLVIRSGDTPGIRLYQDNSEGYTSHSWLISGHEQFFSIRSVPSGTFSLKIKRYAPTNSLVISGNGNIGLGIDDPDAKLEVNGQVKITGGSPANGKVLTSNDNGLASWETINEITGNTLDEAYDQGSPGAGRTITADNGAVRIAGSGGLEVDGRVKIAGGSPGNGKVLTSDNNGLASWLPLSELSGLTLDEAYDHDTPGAGRTITADHGAVRIAGSDGLEVSGQVKISGGSPGDGKVLTSDNNGLASWKFITYPPGNTLDEAYDLGGQGAGRTITADNGAVKIAGTDGLEVNGKINITGGSGLDVDGKVKITGGSGLDVDGKVQITGTNGLEVEGQVKIAGGAPGVGKVLTSDTDGLASWQTLGSVTGITLDEAYDHGAPGAGRIITADNGAVKIAGSDGLEIDGQVKIAGGSPANWKVLTSDANGLARWDNLSETDPQVGANTTNYLSKWNGSALVKSTIFDNGNIGIGESNPDYRLVIRSGDAPSIRLYQDASGGYPSHSWLISGHEQFFSIRSVPSGSFPFKIKRYAPDNSLVISGNGNIGLGIDDPDAKLEVNGQVKISGGSPGEGKVLTSNSAGLATWENPLFKGSVAEGISDADTAKWNLSTNDHTQLTNIGINSHSEIDAHITSTSAHGINGTLVGTSDTQELTNKTIDSEQNTIINISDSDIKSDAAINASKVADGNVSNTEFQYLNKLTRNIQDQLDEKKLNVAHISADSTTYETIGYFSWVQSRYSSRSGALIYEVDIADRNLDIRIRDVTNNTTIAEETGISSDGFRIVSGFSNPSSNARLAIQVKKSSEGGSSPIIYGFQLEWDTE